MKCKSVITSFDIISIETDQNNFAKGIASVTLTGEVIFFDYYNQFLLKNLKCSEK
jgi:hypothetical protein